MLMDFAADVIIGMYSKILYIISICEYETVIILYINLML